MTEKKKRSPKTKAQESKRMGRPILSTVNKENCSLIEALRIKRQLSQRELGGLLGGICQSTIGRYEKGVIRPRGLILEKLNEMLRAEGLSEISNDS